MRRAQGDPAQKDCAGIAFSAKHDKTAAKSRRAMYCPEYPKAPVTA